MNEVKIGDKRCIELGQVCGSHRECKDTKFLLWNAERYGTLRRDVVVCYSGWAVIIYCQWSFSGNLKFCSLVLYYQEKSYGFEFNEWTSFGETLEIVREAKRTLEKYASEIGQQTLEEILKTWVSNSRYKDLLLQAI